MIFSLTEIDSNSIIEHYKEINELREGITEYIPEEVINYVEHGRNPELFTQSFVERTATENQFTNGKIKAVDEFKQLLTENLQSPFLISMITRMLSIPPLHNNHFYLNTIKSPSI
ncbi:unnamed protein product [Rhizopus microsporus]